MKRMTHDEYFRQHLPHRINLLTTFRARWDPKSSDFIGNENVQFRDLYRCAKDIAPMMVRLFLYEMGLKLKKGESNVIVSLDNKEWNKEVIDQVEPPFSINALTVDDIKNEGLFDEVCEVLRFANRAVAHIDASDVNHDFKSNVDNQRLFKVVNFVERMVKERIYGANNEDYDLLMKDRMNDMARTCLVELVKVHGLLNR
jgi:hypothetical protein